MLGPYTLEVKIHEVPNHSGQLRCWAGTEMELRNLPQVVAQ